MSIPFRIATCSIEAWRASDNRNRSVLLRQILKSIKGNADMVLFPAGFYIDVNENDTFIETNVDMIREELIMHSSDIVVCIGLDMRDGMDELCEASHNSSIINSWHLSNALSIPLSCRSDFASLSCVSRSLTLRNLTE